MTTIPREARDGLMRAWVAILSDRHPEVLWIPGPADGEPPIEVDRTEEAPVATVASLAAR